MNINVNTIVENWIKNEYPFEAISTEYRRLTNGIEAFYDNGLISREKRDLEYKKIEKAVEKWEKLRIK